MYNGTKQLRMGEGVHMNKKKKLKSLLRLYYYLVLLLLSTWIKYVMQKTILYLQC